VLQKNKEGLSSCFGYFGVYALSMRIGLALNGARKQFHLKNQMLIVSGLLYLIYFACGLRPSRRLADAAYVLWVTALCLGHLACFLWVELITGGYPMQAAILESINKNQLLVFLLGNVLTGLINMHVQTLLIDSPAASVVMVLGYAVLIVMAAMAVDAWKSPRQ
jgi:phosphatidylinositol glycan class W